MVSVIPVTSPGKPEDFLSSESFQTSSGASRGGVFSYSATGISLKKQFLPTHQNAINSVAFTLQSRR